MVLTKSKLESIRDKEIADHNKRLAAIESLLDLVDPVTQAVPESFSGMLFPVEASIREPIRRTPLLDPMEILTQGERTILDYMELDPNREWTSGDIRDYLTVSGFPLPENKEAAMNAISLALNNLMGKNKIRRVHEGRGRNPHRYRFGGTTLISTSEEPAEAGS